MHNVVNTDLPNPNMTRKSILTSPRQTSSFLFSLEQTSERDKAMLQPAIEEDLVFFTPRPAEIQTHHLLLSPQRETLPCHAAVTITD